MTKKQQNIAVCSQMHPMFRVSF